MELVQSRSSYQGLPDPFPTHAKRHGYVEPDTFESFVADKFPAYAKRPGDEED